MKSCKIFYLDSKGKIQTVVMILKWFLHFSSPEWVFMPEIIQFQMEKKFFLNDRQLHHLFNINKVKGSSIKHQKKWISASHKLQLSFREKGDWEFVRELFFRQCNSKLSTCLQNYKLSVTKYSNLWLDMQEETILELFHWEG